MGDAQDRDGRDGESAMTRRYLLATVGLAAIAAFASCRRDPESEALERLGRLRGQQDRLWKDFQSVVAEDPLLAEATADKGEVVLALDDDFIERTVRDVAKQYLDRVVLDLPLEVSVDKEGKVAVKKLVSFEGTWKVNMVVHRVRGVLSALAPEVSVREGDRIRLKLPVTLREGFGWATLRFKWDASGAASAVCRDFEVAREIEGRVLPETYQFNGELRLAASEDSLVLRPSFGDARVRLKVDLTPDSWAQLAAALEEQDSFFKCGIALKPPDVMEKLKGIAARGFDVKLPKSLFRTITLPASLRQSVQVQGRSFDLSVKPSGFRTAQSALWSSAQVQLKRESR
jgi:hypothetical protein